MNNPLYYPPTAPDFANIRPEHAEIIPQIIAENREKLAKILENKEFSWENLVLPLAQMENRLSKAVSPITHLHAVTSTDEWRSAYEKILPELSAYGNDLAQNEGLYRAFQFIKNSNEYNELSPSRKKLIDDTLANFEAGGVNLPECEKALFKANSLKLSELTTKFSNQVLDATQAWDKVLADDSRLAGVPDVSKALLKQLAEIKGENGYRITLDAPAVMPILSYAHDRDLRAEVYRAYQIRASDLSENGKWDNAPIIKEIMKLRQDQAQLLGQPDHATRKVARRMTQKPEVVFDFLHDLLRHSKNKGVEEMRQLTDFAKEKFGLEALQAYDVAYVAEALRQEKYAISQEELRPYFPIDAVLNGLFSLCKRLFALDFQENKTLSVWHNDVMAFDVLQNGTVIAQFYLDLYARPNKRGGAWMDSAVSRFRDGEVLQLPVAYLVGNFTPAVGSQPACLNHQELLTLLHEFGHGLHHMLTTIDDLSQSGINGVEWDAVEQPSQFMENYGYEYEALKQFSRHVETGEPLPEALFTKLLAAKNFNSAMAMLRQIEFALFDFTYHSGDNYAREPLAVLKEIRAQVAVTPEYADNRFPMQFSHIFAGGYSAGYYSYKWAEVLSADSFSAFIEEGVFNPETGKRFRDEILARGSSRSSMESFIAFRGREPKVDALLKDCGLI